MDRTSLTSPDSDHDLTTARAVSVWKYLSAENLDRNTYATGPLWAVVDGPWHLSRYLVRSGYSVFTPNSSYFAGAPHLAKFEELPFASDTAEFNGVLDGAIDYGYI
jgi:peptide/nickel transport system substrate-binding protein